MLPTGEKFYAEQISHHPPITNFLLEGVDDSYTFSGNFEYKVWPTGLSSFQGSRIGKQVLSFKDGGLISIKDPNIELSGLTYGDRIHNMVGVAKITDHINRIEAEVVYNPKTSDASYLSSFKKKLWGSSKPKPYTDLL